MIRYQTQRLSLRDVSAQDADFIHRLYNDPDCMRFIGDRGISDHEKALAYIASMQAANLEHGYGLYVTCLTETGKAIGICGLVKRDYLEIPDIGFALLPEYRRDGLALEAAEATLAYAGSLNIKQLGAIVKPENMRSIALLEKLAFSYHSPITLPDGERISLYRRQLNSAPAA
jgi:RimJ/RimL family protein N-acetyltransferase